jgi:hypothetical protein
MNEPAYEQKRNETAAFVAIKLTLQGHGVFASDLRISDALCAYAIDYAITGDDLKRLNRYFLRFLNEVPDAAIRRYITEEAPKVEPFDAHIAIRRIRKLLHARGIDREAFDVASAVRRMMDRQKLATKPEAYAAYQAMLAPVNVAAGWSRLAFATWIEKELTR